MINMKKGAYVKRQDLIDFVNETADLVESTPVPDGMMELGKREGLTEDQCKTLWVAAGIASKIALVVMNDPLEFVHGPKPEKDVRVKV